MLTFDHYPTAADPLALRATGVQVRPLRALPMVGVQGTSVQIPLLPALPGHARCDHLGTLVRLRQGGCSRAMTSDRRVATIKSGFRDSESGPEPLLWGRVDVSPPPSLAGIYLARLYARAFFCRCPSYASCYRESPNALMR